MRYILSNKVCVRNYLHELRRRTSIIVSLLESLTAVDHHGTRGDVTVGHVH